MMLWAMRLLLTLAVLPLSGRPAFGQSGATSGDERAIAFLVVAGICLAVYLIPSAVAFYRGHPNRWPILVINLVFGGTGIGWLGSLIWAFGAVHRSATGSNGGESGLNLFVNDPVVVRIDPNSDTAPDPVAQLARLKSLFDSGTLTADEYERLRRPLVERLVRRVS